MNLRKFIKLLFTYFVFINNLVNAEFINPIARALNQKYCKALCPDVAWNTPILTDDTPVGRGVPLDIGQGWITPGNSTQPGNNNDSGDATSGWVASMIETWPGSAPGLLLARVLPSGELDKSFNPNGTFGGLFDTNGNPINSTTKPGMMIAPISSNIVSHIVDQTGRIFMLGQVPVGGFTASFLPTPARTTLRFLRLARDGAQEVLRDFTISIVKSGVPTILFPISVFHISQDTQGRFVGSFFAADGDYINNPNVNRYTVTLRLNANGVLDTSFGGVVYSQTGVLTPGQTATPGVTLIGPSIVPPLTSQYPFVTIEDILIQRNGRILIGGNLFGLPGTSNTNWLARFNDNGLLDTSFAGTGIFLQQGAGVQTFVQMADTRYLILDGTNVGTVFRLFANGTIDTTFGINGRATLDWSLTPLSGLVGGEFQDLVLQPDGRIVIFGFRLTPGTTPASLRRVAVVAAFNSDGTPDLSLIKQVCPPDFARLQAGLLQPQNPNIMVDVGMFRSSASDPNMNMMVTAVHIDTN